VTSRRDFPTIHRGWLGTVALAVTLLVAACSSSGSQTGGANTPGPTLVAGTPSPSGTGGISLPADIAQSGTLKLGTEAAGAPFEFIPEGSSTIQGFEADLWNAIGQKLGVKVEASSIDFDGLIPAVQSGRFDMAMAAISDHSDREEAVTFVDYMYSKSGIVVPDANPHNITSDPFSLCGLTGGAARGEDYATFISETFSAHCTNNGKPAVHLNSYPAHTDALLALSAGRVDFTLDNFTSAAYQVAHVHAKIVPTPLMPKFYDGIIIKKDNAELQQAILSALEELLHDGIYQQILAKWHVSAVVLPDPGINLATARPLPTPTP
jgi:polar amino acid transport system substrate-binding protein